MNYEYISSINFSNANNKWTSLSRAISMILSISYLHDQCLMSRLLKKYGIVENVLKLSRLDFEPLIAD